MHDPESGSAASKFSNFNWNNCRLYSLKFPNEKHRLEFNIDYALRNPISHPEFGKWELVPAILSFENVSDFRCSIDQGQNVELDIVHIQRSYISKSPNGMYDLYNFQISLAPDGLISFTATGFEQKYLGNSRIVDQYDLQRSDLA